MSTIVNIRGTSGSGKTTVARGIMAQYPHRTAFVEEGGRKPLGYELRPQRGGYAPGDNPIADMPNLYVVGSYENVCGGCDAIKTQDEICDRVRRFAALGDVMFEGLLMSHIYDRYRLLDIELEALGHHFIFGWLDTPLQVCLDRVQARRDARAAAKGTVATPLDVENTTNKWHSNRLVFEKMRKAGRDVRWIPWEDPVNTVWSWLSKGQPLVKQVPLVNQVPYPPDVKAAEFRRDILYPTQPAKVPIPGALADHGEIELEGVWDNPLAELV